MTNHAGEVRFAIYFAPVEDSPLHRFGRACLGRDVVTGAPWPQPIIENMPATRWREMTASARMYGFHATLKPPFCMRAGRTPDELIRRLDLFASRRWAFDAPPLRVTRIADFIALVPDESSAALSTLAESCVRDLDEFREPLSLEEHARRQTKSLSPRQKDLLATWGYPYVLDEWRFHMTLANGLASDEIERLCVALGRLAAPCDEMPLHVDGVCLFEQPATDAPFMLVRRFPFGGESRE